MAGPFGASHEHEVVGILTDGGNHGVGMRSDCAHAGTCRFVPHFENHVVVGTIFLGCVLEELDGFAGIAVCTFDVPVDNYVDVVVDGCVHDVLEVAPLQGLALFAAQVAAALILEFFLGDTHGEADDFDIHLSYHRVDGFFGIEHGGTVCSRAPEKAHALHLDSLVGIIRAGSGEFASVCLEFAVGAYRAKPACADGHGGSRGQADNCKNFLHLTSLMLVHRPA